MGGSPPFRAAPGSPDGATLAFEAATPRGSVALARDGSVLAEVRLPEGVQVSASYVPALSELFAAAGDAAVARVAVSAGPGSFTGLRVGLAAAKGLCLPSALPLVAVATLEALALVPFLAGGAPSPAPGTVLCPVLDARKKEVYCAAFRVLPPGSAGTEGDPPAFAPGRGAPPLRRLLPDAPLDPARLLSLLPPEGEVLFVGDGVDAFGPLFRERLGPRALLAPPEGRYPRAAATAILGELLGRAGGDAPAGGALPRYLRRSEAEEAASRRP